MTIDSKLAAFLEGGNSILLGTRSASLEPNVTRAAGLRVIDADRIEVLVPRATSARALSNLRANAEAAVCVCSPVDFTSFQLKGSASGFEDGTAEDVALAERQMRSFADGIAAFGNTAAQVRNLWLFDCWRVSVRVTEIYVQTPGPGAGAVREEAGDD